MNIELKSKYISNFEDNNILENLYYYWQCKGCDWTYSDDFERGRGYCKDFGHYFSCINKDQIGTKHDDLQHWENCVKNTEREKIAKSKMLRELLKV